MNLLRGTLVTVAVSLLAGGFHAAADVVHTPIPGGLYANSATPASIDLNADGITDVQIGGFPSAPYEVYGTPGVFAGYCSAPSGINQAYAHYAGEVIGDPSYFTCDSSPVLLQSTCLSEFFSIEYPCPFYFESLYLGVRFQINGNTHFGWLAASGDTGSLTITGFAYETIPGRALGAGLIETPWICPPSIFWQPPSSVNRTPGESLTLGTYVDAYVLFSPGCQLQWLRDGQPLADDARIRGTTTPTLTIDNAQRSDTGIYALHITTDCGEVFSIPSRVRITDSLPCAPFTGTSLTFRDPWARAATTPNSTLNPAATTIEAWIYWDGSPNTVGFITSKGLEHMEFHVGNHLPGSYQTLRFIPTPGVYLDAAFGSLPVAQWVHVAGAYDPAAGIAKVYINGVDQNAENHGTAPITTPMLSSDPHSFYVGFRNSLVHGAFPFSGKIDDIRVWNYARSREQIVASMNIAVDPDQTGLLALYRCDEGTGIIAANTAAATGSALNLTLGNGATWSETRTCCLADFNGDGSVGSTDLFDYLAAFFDLTWTADINQDFLIDSTDFFSFLTGFFYGCE